MVSDAIKELFDQTLYGDYDDDSHGRPFTRFGLPERVRFSMRRWNGVELRLL